MGVYFDLNANANYTAAPVFAPFYVYLMLVNPTAPVDGFECTVTALGAPHFVLEKDLGANAIDVDDSVNGFAVGAAAPYPGGQILVLVRWRVMLLSSASLYYYISQATTPSLPGGWPVVTGQGVLRRCGVINDIVEIPVACVNSSGCITDTETVSCGAIKALYH